MGANVELEQVDGNHGTPYECEEGSESDEACMGTLVNNMLFYLLTNLKEGAIDESEWEEPDSDWAEDGTLRAFWQKKYDDSWFWTASSLSPLGHVFIPDQCTDEDAECKLHIWLHGCMGSNREGDIFEYGGVVNPMNQYAVANDLIIVYPDVQPSWSNIGGCWDSTGYSSKNYQTKDSPQATYLKNIIERLKEPIDDNFNYDAG